MLNLQIIIIIPSASSLELLNVPFELVLTWQDFLLQNSHYFSIKLSKLKIMINKKQSYKNK